jgi:hypothetical protein
MIMYGDCEKTGGKAVVTDFKYSICLHWMMTTIKKCQFLAYMVILVIDILEVGLLILC